MWCSPAMGMTINSAGVNFMLGKTAYLAIVGKPHEGYWLAKYPSISSNKPELLRPVTKQTVAMYQRKKMLCRIGFGSDKILWHTVPFFNRNEAENYRPLGCSLPARIV